MPEISSTSNLRFKKKSKNRNIKINIQGSGHFHARNQLISFKIQDLTERNNLSSSVELFHQFSETHPQQCGPSFKRLYHIGKPHPIFTGHQPDSSGRPGHIRLRCSDLRYYDRPDGEGLGGDQGSVYRGEKGVREWRECGWRGEGEGGREKGKEEG